MNIINVDQNLQEGPWVNQREIKEETGATAGLPVPQSERSPQHKDPHQFKLRDLDMKVQGSQKATQRLVR